MMLLLLLAHAAATCIMVGVIWFVQVVHYPLFDHVGQDAFVAYETAHARLTTRVVAPAMLVEALTGVGLVWQLPPDMLALQVWLGLALLAVIWLSTVFLQMPQHHTLSLGFHQAAYRALVKTNWLRTVAWSLRAVLVLWMLARVVGA